MTPVAFLVVSPSGNVELLPISKSPSAAPSSVDRIADLIEKSPEIAEKIKNLFAKKKIKEESDAKSEEAETETTENN